MTEENPIRFYDRIFAGISGPTDYEKDGPQAVLNLVHNLAIDNTQSGDPDVRSISSTTVETGDQNLRASTPMSPPQSMSGSGQLSAPESRSETPMTQSRDRARLLYGIGTCHIVKDHALPIQLYRTYNEYQGRFVTFRKRQACGESMLRKLLQFVLLLTACEERLKAILTDRLRSSLEEDSFQLAVLSHDKLCWSNDPDRMNDERCKLKIPCLDL